MTYQELQKKYPNKEIKLVPKEYEETYKQWGFSTVQTCKQPAFGEMFDYCFMVENV